MMNSSSENPQLLGDIETIVTQWNGQLNPLDKGSAQVMNNFILYISRSIKFLECRLTDEFEFQVMNNEKEFSVWISNS